MVKPLTALVSPGYGLAVLENLEARGIDPVPVFGPDWVSRVRQPNGQIRLTLDEWLTLLRRATVASGDPAFVIRLADGIRGRHLGMLGFLLMSCDCLAEAALILQRYERLHDDFNAADFHVEGDRFSLTWRPLIDQPPAELVLMSMTLWAHHARWLSERPDLVADVRFAFARPSEPAVLEALQRAFGGEVLFNQPLNQMHGEARLLALPVAQRNREVHASLREQADNELTRLLGHELGFLTHLEWVLAQGLEHGRVTLQQTAEAVHLAPRTLQARLEAQGSSFREVLDRVRHRLAEHHLGNLATPLSSVAAKLGFADQSAFQHAFKRWSGQSPGEFRRRLTGAATPAD